MNKKVLLILLADPDRARTLATELQTPEFEVIVAESSDQLHRTLGTQRVDILVLENELQAFVSGLDILEKIFDDVTRPATALLAKMTPKIEPKVKSLGIDSVLPPDADPETIAKTVRALARRAGTARANVPANARRLVAGAEIGPLPQLLVKLAGYLDDEQNVALTDLAADISIDPKITADLLRVINSAALGMNRKITTVLDVVKLLGVRKTISLILSSSVVRNQKSLCRQMSVADRDWYNRRSVVIASTAHAFADHLGKVSPDTAFVLGLFQELGIPVLAAALGERYLLTLRRVRQTGILKLEQAEEQELGFTHAAVSAAMLQKWGLPPTMVGPVLDHHSAENIEGKSGIEQRFVNCMRIGEAFANLSDGHYHQRYPILTDLFAQYGADEAGTCRFALQEGVAKAAESCRLFAIEVPDSQALGQLVEKMASDAAKEG